MKVVLNLLFFPLIKIHEVWYSKISIIKKILKLFFFFILAYIWLIPWFLILVTVVSIFELNIKYITQIVLIVFFAFFGIYSFIKNKKKFNLLCAISLIFILLILFVTFIIAPSQVVGNSMNPTIKNGQNVLVYKINKNYQRGDIITFESPKNTGIEYISRIIALEGDKLVFKENKVYLNGKLLQESYTTGETNLWQDGFVKEGEEIVVPPDKVFVMSDNRQKSSDSREWGYVSVNKIIGKVIYVY
jgi:signal peptidase I